MREKNRKIIKFWTKSCPIRMALVAKCNKVLYQCSTRITLTEPTYLENVKCVDVHLVYQKQQFQTHGLEAVEVRISMRAFYVHTCVIVY